VQLIDKVAFITGAAAGIGLGIAERFAEAGAVVLLVDWDDNIGTSAAARLQSQGKSAHFIQANLAEPADITRAIESALALCGKLDIVVNNAATFLGKPVEQITVAEWDFLMAVNLRAPFLVAQAALPALKATRGTILNIGSTAALRVFSPNLPYITSKAGLITMTKLLAQELHPHRIRVNCICPGAVDTPALHRAIDSTPNGTAEWDRLHAQGYLTTPEQIAAVSLYLVSDEASAVTGSIVVADAGAMLS